MTLCGRQPYDRRNSAGWANLEVVEIKLREYVQVTNTESHAKAIRYNIFANNWQSQQGSSTCTSPFVQRTIEGYNQSR